MSKSELFKGLNGRTFWGAIAYADRKNGQKYVKADHDAYHDAWSDTQVPKSVSNKTYAKEALQSRHLITVEDMALGEKIRDYFKGLSFKALMGKLNDFEMNVLKFVDIEDFESDKSANYHLAVAASLPTSYRRALARDEVDATIREASHEHIGSVGDHVELDVEVLRTVHSEKWQTNFVTVLDADKHVIFFSQKRSYEVGTKLHIKGRIKRLTDDGQTQLNYVKVVK